MQQVQEEVRHIGIDIGDLYGEVEGRGRLSIGTKEQSLS